MSWTLERASMFNMCLHGRGGTQCLSRQAPTCSAKPKVSTRGEEEDEGRRLFQDYPHPILFKASGGDLPMQCMHIFMTTLSARVDLRSSSTRYIAIKEPSSVAVVLRLQLPGRAFESQGAHILNQAVFFPNYS
ncbi:hypothetical protein VNO77_34827 [Canavalia gladiata]|uniref:Uncharacterized protein n=1 Tax=Canavalia gladiata TaxID=3824 RepID=A0AAN9KI06_CANGL